jgi:hypothetical protein
MRISTTCFAALVNPNTNPHLLIFPTASSDEKTRESWGIERRRREREGGGEE